MKYNILLSNGLSAEAKSISKAVKKAAKMLEAYSAENPAPRTAVIEWDGERRAVLYVSPSCWIG